MSLLEDRIEKIKQARNNGRYAEDVAEEIGVPIKTLRIYANHNCIKLPPFRDQSNRYSARRDSRKDELIKEGLKLEAIAHRFGITRERIRQYILVTRQHEIWEHAKEQRRYYEKQRDKMLGILINQIETAGLRNASVGEKLSYEKAIKYLANKKWHGIYFDELFSIYNDYFTFKERGEKVPLSWFAKKYDRWESVIGRIFKNVGLKPLVKEPAKKRVATPKFKKQALERSVEVELSNRDISYFLKVSIDIPRFFFNDYYKGDKKRRVVKSSIKRFGLLKMDTLYYRTASEIYEAKDADFRKEEILELCEINDEVYNYALKHKKEIADQIMRNLRIMFPNKPVTKPYVNFSLV